MLVGMCVEDDGRGKGGGGGYCQRDDQPPQTPHCAIEPDFRRRIGGKFPHQGDAIVDRRVEKPAAVAIPILPPMLRMRLKRLVAFPISRLEIPSMVMVVKGTNNRLMEMPCMNCGQKKSQ